MNTVITISVLLGILTYAGFWVFCIVNWLRGITGQALLLAASLSLMWLSVLLFPVTQPFYPVLEPLAIAGWIILLVRALGIGLRQVQDMKAVFWTFLVALFLAAVTSLVHAAGLFGFTFAAVGLTTHLAMVVVNVLGLVLVEQLAQNAVTDYRWRLRYLNIGLGMMFSFGLIYHALLILFQTQVVILAAMQPAVMALVVPFIIVASLRNRANKLRFSLSRNFVFRTGVLVVSGTFLLLLGLFGYLARLFAGDIGITVAVFFSIVALMFAFVVAGSSRYRGQLRVMLAKTFFEYRYDYRGEWMNVTTMLSIPDADFDLPQQAQRAILSLLNAKQACLWVNDENQALRPVSNIEAGQWMEPLPPGLTETLTRFYAEYDWVLDLKHLPEEAGALGECLSGLAPGFVPAAEARYLIPLFIEKRLFGLCLAGPAEVAVRLGWEEFDILKLVSTQCAGFLALQEANRSLMESEQLAAVNQMSAFLMHDLKTITAQLSLMLENAERHRKNTAFIDDMLSTTRNSVQRMERIIAGLRDPDPRRLDSAQRTELDLSAWLRNKSGDFKDGGKALKFDFIQEPVRISTDIDALETALIHVMNNALQAVDTNGLVTVQLSRDEHWGLIRVIDDGVGMEDEFIQKELFTPFRSTKGLTGMGIGAYQARDNIRKCGGDLQVESKVGVGTTFTIKLPLTGT